MVSISFSYRRFYKRTIKPDRPIDTGVLQPEEFSAERRKTWRRRHDLSRTDAGERHARVDDRSGRQAVLEIERRGVAAGLSGTSIDRESAQLVVEAMATQAEGRAERDAGLLMMHAQWKRAPRRRRTLGADKAYDVRECVDVTRELGCAPHVAQNLNRPGGSAIDARATRHAGSATSQHARPRIEPAFGWLKRSGDEGDVSSLGRIGIDAATRTGLPQPSMTNRPMIPNACGISRVFQ
jgi:hypothetical protein